MIPSAIILAVLPLAYWPGAYPFTMPKVQVIVCALAICCMKWESGPRPPAKALRGLMALGVLWLGIAFQWSVDITDSVYGRGNDYATGFWAILAYATLFLSASNVAQEQHEELKGLAVKAGTLCAIVGILQYVGARTGFVSEIVGGRAVGTIGGPPYFGAYLAMIAPLALGRKSWLSLVLIILGVGASGSRGAFLALFVSVLTYFGMREDIRERFKSVGTAWSAGIVGLALAIPGFLARPLLMSDAGRVEAWKEAWQQFLNHPWHGYGVFAAMAPSQGYKALHLHAHNDFLEVLAVAGLPALIIYAAAWAVLIYYAIRSEKPEYCGALAALFVTLKLNPPCLASCSVAAVLAGLMVVEKFDCFGLDYDICDPAEMMGVSEAALGPVEFSESALIERGEE